MPFQPKVEIYFHDGFPLLQTVEIFKMNGRDFHDERSRFSWWMVEIFKVNGRDFHGKWSRFSWWMVEMFIVNGWDFLGECSRFSWWMVKIFMVNGRDFHGERLRFLWWTVEIFMMNGKVFYHERSRFSWWQVQNCLLLQLKTWSAREASRHSPVMDNCSTISHKCYPYLPSRWVLLFVSGVGGRNEHAGWI